MMTKTLKIRPPKPECPVAADKQSVIRLSREVIHSLRRLKHKRSACKHCILAETCHLQSDFRAEIDAAVDEIAEEWSNQ